MVRQYTRPAMMAAAPYRGMAAAAVYQNAAIMRREVLADQERRERERSRNLWRAGLASGVLVLALSTGFLAGASSDLMSGLFASATGQARQTVLSAADVKRGELRTGRVLFTLPDGETCRPMHFDNVTGEMSPGAGPVPCVAGENRPQGSGRFGWRKQ